MTHIEQLIKDLCPNGVEWRKLGELVRTLPKGTLKTTDLTEDGFPVINSGKSLYGYYNDFNNECEAVTIAARGEYAGWISYFNEKFWAGGLCYPYTSKDENIISTKFLYYWLKRVEKNIMDTLVSRGGIPALNKMDLERIEIPVPPMEIQNTIVRCLDAFSALAAELQAELQLRRKQYEHYRTHLLTPHSGSNSADKSDDCNWVWMTLGEVGEMIKGSGIQKSDFVEEGMPCIHYGQVHTYYGTFAYKNKSYISEELYAKCKKAHKGDLVIATTSEDVEACCKATAWLGDEDVAVSGDAHIFRHNQNPKYMAYLFQTEMFAQQKRKCATGAKVTRVNGASMLKFKFPFPSLEEQARIVDILDKFEALTTSLSEGIPAEQAAQQKRYEYFRDLLLTFDRKQV